MVKIEESRTAEGAVRPETLLPPLNRSLLRLRAAAVDLQDTTIDDDAVKVLRRTTIPEILGNRYLVAVAGAQGAGKTTLIREIYDLDDTWLGSADAGQGERVPVMVVEDETAKSASGWAIEINGAGLDTRPIPPEDFRRSLSGLIDSRLALGLTVPATLFGKTDRGFLLLPGYESVSPSNQEWQTLMRQAMVAAPAVLVVVDRALLASDAQHAIMEDLRDEYVQGVLPLVVISKTERLDADDPERVELHERAATLFALAPEQERIVMAGSGDPAYREVWLPHLREVLSRGLPGTRQMRLRQLDHLRHTVRREVRDLRNHVRDAAYGEPDNPEARSYRKCLEHFDDAKLQAVAEYTRSVRSELDRHRRAANLIVDDAIEARSAEEHELARYIKEWTAGRAYVYQRKLERGFEACWHRAGDDERGFATGHLRATKRAIQELGPLLREGDSGHGLDTAVFTDLMVLGKGEYDEGYRFSDDLPRHITLLPLMALEALRTAMEAPQLVGVSPTNLTPGHAVREPDAGTVLLEIGEERLAMLAGFGAVLGIDVLANGGVGSPPELAATLQKYLFGGAQLTKMSGAAIGSLAGLVAVAALGAATVNYGNRLLARQANMARQIIDVIYEEHQARIEEGFARLLQQLRRQIEFSLGRYFRVGAETARAIEIDRAIAECDDARKRLLDAFDGLVV